MLQPFRDQQKYTAVTILLMNCWQKTSCCSGIGSAALKICQNLKDPVTTTGAKQSESVLLGKNNTCSNCHNSSSCNDACVSSLGG
ncbi:MAG: hypothetical protein MJ175_05850, partial [Clostridia bacterium]|nr:hypothetical protein [Clostridia bacterium]